MAEKKIVIDIPKVLQFTQKPYEVTLTSQDVILYNLGIGFS
jgi:hypothetical protein